MEHYHDNTNNGFHNINNDKLSLKKIKVFHQ